MCHYILILVLGISLSSCWNKAPKLCLSEDYSFIKDKNGSVLKDIEIKQYDSTGDFIASGNFHKKAESKGENKIYLFKKNEGYSFHGLNALFLSKNYTYKIIIHTIGFEDSLFFKMDSSFAICR